MKLNDKICPICNNGISLNDIHGGYFSCSACGRSGEIKSMDEKTHIKVEPKLLPCPLCGKEANSMSHGIACTNCGLWLGKSGYIIKINSTLNQVWNTRINNKLKRSNNLLRLYFGVWIRCIVEDCEGYCTKEKIEEYHEYIKTQLLPQIIKIKTKKEIVEYNKPISLKTFNNSDMVKYMNNVQIFALEKWNIVLPLPEEKGYEQLVEKYKEWIK
jgi:RecJ-like exonuclease